MTEPDPQQTFHDPSQYERWESYISWNIENTNAWAPGTFQILPPIKEHDRHNFNGHFETPLPKKIEDYIHEDTFPLPLPEDREGYHGDHHFEYWVAGLRDYLKLKLTFEKYGIGKGRIFELGCSSGRVLRQFCAQKDPYELWASDLNFKNVAWVTTHLPEDIRIVQNSALPQLPFEDNFFEAITAFSVFTHIETFELAWLAELRRILKPGGICYLTIMSDKLWAELKTRAPNVYDFELQFRPAAELDGPMPQPRVVSRLAGNRSNTANIYISHDYIHRVWGRLFKVEEIRTFDHYYAQDVVILRKQETP